MRAPHAYRGFTLIELIAAITIMAILAAVALPRMTAADSFADRGFADELAANLRRARIVAMTTGCEVQVTVNNTGYLAQQRGAGANNHCAPAGAWATTIFSGEKPSHAGNLLNRQAVFATSGTSNAAWTLNIGSRQVSLENSGLVTSR
jgi:prepilin-type N-terminal cleavage/methylation domain-containing protein